MPETLDVNAKQKTVYCVPLWQRDEQIRLAIQRVKGRLEPRYDKRSEPVAVVCYGPSLNDTWEEIRKFKHVVTCSGAHKFLVERGIIPTWHVEVDPRPHKVELIGPPTATTEYLIASCCHQRLFDHLEGRSVKLWHVFANEEESFRVLPRGEWALYGGSSVGLRALAIARFIGFTDLHVFGMDGSEGESGKHAAAHPMQPGGHSLVEYPEKSGVMWRTTPSLLACAQQTWHELDELKDVTATFYGTGLVQAMAKDYKPKRRQGQTILGVNKPELISAEYRELNARLHRENVAYGVGGGKLAPTVTKLTEALKTTSVLDYGCGKGYLAKALPFPIWEYDPAISEKSESPRPADIVICSDVLEHIEPERLRFVLDDLRRCTRKVGYFVIHTGPARKHYADGRNTHLIQQCAAWWRSELSQFFEVGKLIEQGPELHVVVGPKVAKARPQPMEANV
jgi:hypothetical protein